MILASHKVLSSIWQRYLLASNLGHSLCSHITYSLTLTIFIDGDHYNDDNEEKNKLMLSILVMKIDKNSSV